MMGLASDRVCRSNGLSDMPCLWGAGGGVNPVESAALDIRVDFGIAAKKRLADVTFDKHIELFRCANHFDSPLLGEPPKKTKKNVLCGEAVSAHPRQPFRSAKP